MRLVVIPNRLGARQLYFGEVALLDTLHHLNCLGDQLVDEETLLLAVFDCHRVGR